ncbi:MAG: hypothetical protein QME74_07790 [Candidatus Edwardsbacteria bacterium]|nr:hypothetical protein [Candidatus Edwardsbacteria bacterium]
MMNRLNGENRYAIFKEIVSSVIHDLKNPLSAITLGLEFIEMNAAGGKIPPQAISGAISSAARIDQLLDALSLYFHDENTPPTAVPLAHLLGKARLLVGYYLTGSQVKLQIEEGGDGHSVLVNLGQTYQAVVMLLIGMVKRSRPGTAIRAVINQDRDWQVMEFSTNGAGQASPADADEAGRPGSNGNHRDLAAVCFDTARELLEGNGFELEMPEQWEPPARIALRKQIGAGPAEQGRA